MRNLLIATMGFLVVGGLVVTLLLALPRTTTVTVKQSTQMATAYHPATAKLTIQHVLRGCHVWSNGKTTGAMMRLHLKVGQRLAILDQDVDAHQMLQFAGPMRLRMGGPMMMARGTTITFAKKGIYRLGTKTVEMPGGMMEVKTIGPDNKLRLVVTVA